MLSYFQLMKQEWKEKNCYVKHWKQILLWRNSAFLRLVGRCWISKLETTLEHKNWTVSTSRCETQKISQERHASPTPWVLLSYVLTKLVCFSLLLSSSHTSLHYISTHLYLYFPLLFYIITLNCPPGWFIFNLLHCSSQNTCPVSNPPHNCWNRRYLLFISINLRRWLREELSQQLASLLSNAAFKCWFGHSMAGNGELWVSVCAHHWNCCGSSSSIFINRLTCTASGS